jgi:hypothetical protein
MLHVHSQHSHSHYCYNRARETEMMYLKIDEDSTRNYEVFQSIGNFPTRAI